MLLLTATLAYAALPWECPVLATPADAHALRNTDGGADAVYDRLHAAAMAYWDDECAWVTTTTEDYYGGTETEAVCVAGDVEVVRVDTTREESDGTSYMTTARATLTVSVGTGETWTRITLETSTGFYSTGSFTTSGWDGYEAAWVGAFEELPEDGWLSQSSSGGSSTGSFLSSFDTRSVETPSCAWQWDIETLEGVRTESVAATGGEVQVEHLYGSWSDWAGCDIVQTTTVGGVRTGAVLDADWSDDPTDLDRDGFVPLCDCDEADAVVNPTATDLPFDGIDQDCRDGDDIDGDDDGYDALAEGGDDCDDADAAVHPAARDDAGDGRDGDCDGADDRDADGDGYTADGDDRAPDCDEADATIHPGATETPYDGVDQDCDGADQIDADGDGYVGTEAGGDDCNDRRSTVNPGVSDPPCDGQDADCDGSDECDTGEPPPAAPGPVEDAPPDGGCASTGGTAGTGRSAGTAAWVPLLLLGLRRRRDR